MANYVKFMRGTIAAFNLIPIKDPDTLYFIYENETSASGKLYLGEKSIACNSTSADVVQYLSKLLDVDTSEAVDKNILVYDITSQKWVAAAIEDIYSVPAMTAASAIADGKAGLVPAPKAGDHIKFLRGDGTWAEIPQASGLKYKKVNSVDDIDLTVDGASDYIYLVAKDTGYAEYLIVDNLAEPIGNLNVNLEDYATKEELNNTASSLGELNTKITNLEDSLNNYLKLENYNLKMNELDADIAQLKKSTQWGNLNE